jgi:hypothetical protein
MRRRSKSEGDNNYLEIQVTPTATRDLVSSANTGPCTGRGESPAGTTFRHTGQKWD